MNAEDSDRLYLDSGGRIIFVDGKSQWLDAHLHPEAKVEPRDKSLVRVPTRFIRKLYREGWSASELAEIWKMYSGSTGMVE